VRRCAWALSRDSALPCHCRVQCILLASVVLDLVTLLLAWKLCARGQPQPPAQREQLTGTRESRANTPASSVRRFTQEESLDADFLHDLACMHELVFAYATRDGFVLNIATRGGGTILQYISEAIAAEWVLTLIEEAGCAPDVFVRAPVDVQLHVCSFLVDHKLQLKLQEHIAGEERIDVA